MLIGFGFEKKYFEWGALICYESKRMTRLLILFALKEAIVESNFDKIFGHKHTLVKIYPINYKVFFQTKF